MGKLRTARRIGLAALIAALHLAAVEALLSLHPPSGPRAAREYPPLNIVTLPRLQDVAPAPGGPATLTPQLAAPGPFPIPALPAPPVIAPAAPDPALAALGQYLECRLPGELRSTEDKERCARIMRELPVGPPRDLPLTEEEKALALRFEHEHKALNAPLAVPCLFGAMINPVCVAMTLLTGGDWITTYADTPNRPKEPLATGMVGRSGKPPGYP